MNNTERVSFSVEIVQCKSDDCIQNDTQIKELLKNIMFTFYYTEENLAFGKTKDKDGKLIKRAIVSRDKFHSKF